jgi:DNA/RNA-binding protein KIN17
VNDEQRERPLIAEQIEWAEQEAQEVDEEDSKKREEGLLHEEGYRRLYCRCPQSLPWSRLRQLHPKVSNSIHPSRLSTLSSAADKPGGKRKETPLSAAERVILEEHERNRRRMEREGTTAQKAPVVLSRER